MRNIIFPFFVAALLSASLASVSHAGEAKGKMSTQGKTVELKYAYALAYNNEEGFIEKPVLRIALTDREIPIETLSGPMTDDLDTLARKGKVAGILIKLDPVKLSKGGVQGTILYPPNDPRKSLPFFSAAGNDTGFEKIELAGGNVKGSVTYAFKGEDLPSFDFDVTFTAPVVKDKVTAKLTGAQALNSPQLKALLAYQTAIKKGDFDAARKLATTDGFSQLDAYIAQAGKAAVMEMMKSEPSAEELKRQVRGVFLRGTSAYIVLKGAAGKSLEKLVQSGKDWKID